MRKMLKRFSVILAAILIFVAFPFAGLKVNASNSSEIYQINGYDRPDIIFDSQSNVVHGYAYCLNLSRHSSHYSCDYIRFRLSDTSYGTIFDDNHYGVQGDEAADEAEARRLLLNLLLKQDNLSSVTTLSMQDVVWNITNHYLTYASHPGLISESNQRIKDYLTAEPYYDFDQYDVYYYQAQDTAYQNMLGNLFVPTDTSFTIEKTVLNLSDTVESYNGADGTSGFEVNINVYDTLGDRPVTNETFVFSSVDSEGNTSSQSITTDTQGNLSLNILSGQSITVSGFDSVNYRFTLSEASTNMDDTCILDSITSSNGNLIANEDGSYSFDFSQSYSVDIDMVNRHLTTDPVPTTTTTESSEETTATTTTTTTETATTTTTTTTETAATTATTTTAATDASVLGIARDVEETTTAAPTATPTPAPSGVANTGESSHTPRIVAGIVLIVGAAVVMAVRLSRKSPAKK